MSRRFNHRLVKVHRNYTVEEIARRFSIHKNTVRHWVKQGLPTVDNGKPVLILGLVLRAFLQDRRRRARQHCGNGEIYCVKCRSPRRPDGNYAEYLPINTGSGNLRAICPECGRLIHRRVSFAKLDQIRGDLEILWPEVPAHIKDS
jgi:hypothetical protein